MLWNKTVKIREEGTVRRSKFAIIISLLYFVYVCIPVGIGTELLNEIQQVMREDKEKAVQDAVSNPMQVNRHLSSHSQFFLCLNALKKSTNPINKNYIEVFSVFR